MTGLGPPTDRHDDAVSHLHGMLVAREVISIPSHGNEEQVQSRGDVKLLRFPTASTDSRPSRSCG